MMKTNKKFIKAISASILLSLGMANVSIADNALFHSGQASVNSARAAGHGIAAVGKSAVTIVALPFIGVGKVGELSGQAGNVLLEASNAPLDIGDEIVTAGPSPDQNISIENQQ